jgi:hypothetical protein
MVSLAKYTCTAAMSGVRRGSAGWIAESIYVREPDMGVYPVTTSMSLTDFGTQGKFAGKRFNGIVPSIAAATLARGRQEPASRAASMGHSTRITARRAKRLERARLQSRADAGNNRRRLFAVGPSLSTAWRAARLRSQSRTPNLVSATHSKGRRSDGKRHGP